MTKSAYDSCAPRQSSSPRTTHVAREREMLKCGKNGKPSHACLSLFFFFFFLLSEDSPPKRQCKCKCMTFTLISTSYPFLPTLHPTSTFPLPTYLTSLHIPTTTRQAQVPSPPRTSMTREPSRPQIPSPPSHVRLSQGGLGGRHGEYSAARTPPARVRLSGVRRVPF